MKIKSWTGDEVDARVEMGVKTDKFSGDFKNATIVELHDDNSVTLTVIGSPISHRVWLRNCTMLHCPFQVGDKYFPLLESGYYAKDYESISSEEECEALNLGYITGVHTNPSLRTSEEYENEK